MHAEIAALRAEVERLRMKLEGVTLVVDNECAIKLEEYLARETED